MTLEVSRRGLLKAAAASGLLATVASSLDIGLLDKKLLVEARAEALRNLGKVEVKYSICDGCYYGCGIAGYVRDGILTYVYPRDDNPNKPCAKGLAIQQRIYNPMRLLYPVKRTAPKDSPDPKWVRISWEEAYRIISTKLKEVASKYGPESVAFLSTWSSGYHPAHFVQRLAITFGSPNFALPGDCNCVYGLNLASLITFGFVTRGSDPDANTKTVVLWTINRAWTGPYLFRGLVDAKKRGVKFIVVDPKFSATVAKLADIHLRPLPGTDAALALGMAYVLLTENLYDKEFVENWVHGFEEFKKYVLGETDGLPKTPEWAEQKTGVPASLIREAARLMATNKPTTWIGSPSIHSHSDNNIHTCRAIMTLFVLLGMIDVPGGIRIATYPISVPRPGFRMEARARPGGDLFEKRADVKHFPVWAEIMDSIQINKLPEYVEEGKIKAVVMFGSHTLVWPQSRVYEEALKKLEFIVAIDHMLKPWAHKYADVVLPAAMGPERETLPVVVGRNVYLRQKMVEPLGEAKDDVVIVMELAKWLGLGEHFWDGDLEKALNDYLSAVGITVSDMKKTPNWMVTIPAPGPEEYRKYEKGMLRADKKPGFPTPTGKIELYSTRLAKYGYEPIPVYKEPVYRRLPEAKEYPLILMSGVKERAYVHSKFREVPWLRELLPEPYVRMSPVDAEKRGIREGDIVVVENPYCRLTVRAEITAALPPGVVEILHGWYQANVNECVPRVFDPISGLPPFKQAFVEVRKASGGM